MTAAVKIDEDDAVSDAVIVDDSGLRQRRDIVSGEVLPENRLVRFVADPDGNMVPDVGAKLPGRGVWVQASRAALTKAVEKKLFARAAKAQVVATPDLADRTEKALVTRMLGDLGIARLCRQRAGEIIFGQIERLNLGRDHAKYVQRRGVARRVIQHQARGNFGAGDVVGLQGPDGKGQVIAHGRTANGTDKNRKFPAPADSCRSIPYLLRCTKWRVPAKICKRRAPGNIRRRNVLLHAQFLVISGA